LTDRIKALTFFVSRRRLEGYFEYIFYSSSNSSDDRMMEKSVISEQTSQMHMYSAHFLHFKPLIQHPPQLLTPNRPSIPLVNHVPKQFETQLQMMLSAGAVHS